jgi:hypothetical protein
MTSVAYLQNKKTALTAVFKLYNNIALKKDLSKQHLNFSPHVRE